MPATMNVGRFSARVKRKLGIRKDRERQVQALGGLALIVGVLRREPEQVAPRRAL